MPEPERIVVSIEREGEADTYRAVVSGLGGRDLSAGGLALGLDAVVRLSAGDWTLGKLLLRLFPASVDLAPEQLAFFDQRTQLEIGHYLFDQLFGQLPNLPNLAELLAREGQELRIVTNDEHLVRLPWVLLAHEGTTLAKSRRWAVSLARDRTTTDVSLRSLPRVLLVMPEPTGVEKTGRQEHEDHLHQIIEGKADVRYRWAEFWKVVRTWQEFSTALATRDWDVVYFYGHGEGDLADSKLLFESGGTERGKHAVTMEDIALELGEASGVRLIYLNCCSGDAGGFLGAGMQLRAAVPAVLTNRTFVRIPMAQRSGELFFEQLFLEGAVPHAAYAALCRSLVQPGETERSTRPVSWMTPVLHARYGRWESPRLQAAAKLPEKSTALPFFDRSEQGGALSPFGSRLRSADVQGGHAVLWYGGRRQGVGRFHEHLRHGLALPGNRLQALDEFGWPPGAAGSGPFAERRSLVEGFCATLGIGAPAEVSRQLRSRQPQAGDGQRIACYLPVSFPFPGAEPFEPDAALGLLLQLLEAFDEELVPHFEEPFVPVLGLAIEASDPARFRACLRPWMQDLRLERIQLMRLPPLEAVKDYEVESYLQDVPFARKLHPAERDEVVQLLLEDTAGRYDDVVDYLADDPRLRQLVQQVRFPKTRTG